MNYTELLYHHNRLDLTFATIAEEMGGIVHQSYLNKLANGHQKSIKRYSKRIAVEKWIRNARRRKKRLKKEQSNL